MPRSRRRRRRPRPPKATAPDARPTRASARSSAGCPGPTAPGAGPRGTTAAAAASASTAAAACKRRSGFRLRELGAPPDSFDELRQDLARRAAERVAAERGDLRLVRVHLEEVAAALPDG